MPTFFMLAAEETSLLQVTAESQAAIEAAMDRVNMQGRSYTAQGAWYSPTRIDRANPVAGHTDTRVQRVLAINDGVADPTAAALAIGWNMKQALDHVGDIAGTAANVQSWTNVTVAPFNEALYGPLSSWHSGVATRSATANQFPNPLGLDNTSMKWLLGAAAVGIGLYLLWPVIATARAKVTEGTRRIRASSDT